MCNIELRDVIYENIYGNIYICSHIWEHMDVQHFELRDVRICQLENWFPCTQITVAQSTTLVRLYVSPHLIISWIGHGNIVLWDYLFYFLVAFICLFVFVWCICFCVCLVHFVCCICLLCSFSLLWFVFSCCLFTSFSWSVMATRGNEILITTHRTSSKSSEMV